jgi:hypothetical protein
MANVQHKDLPNAELHEPKGVSTATLDSFYVADGAGSGSWKRRLYRYTVSWSPALVAANTSAEQTVTVTGLVLATDTVIGVSKPTAQAGLGIVGWRVSADNTLAVTFGNFTGGGITPTAAETYRLVIWRD